MFWEDGIHHQWLTEVRQLVTSVRNSQAQLFNSRHVRRKIRTKYAVVLQFVVVTTVSNFLGRQNPSSVAYRSSTTHVRTKFAGTVAGVESMLTRSVFAQSRPGKIGPGSGGVRGGVPPAKGCSFLFAEVPKDVLSCLQRLFHRQQYRFSISDPGTNILWPQFHFEIKYCLA